LAVFQRACSAALAAHEDVIDDAHVGRLRRHRHDRALAGSGTHPDQELAQVEGAWIDRRIGSALPLGRAQLLRIALVQQRDVVEDDVAGDRLQPFGAHLREPAPQLAAGEADRATDDDEVAVQPAVRNGSRGESACAPAMLRPEQVERSERGDDLGRRREQLRRAPRVDRVRELEREALRRCRIRAGSRDRGRQHAVATRDCACHRGRGFHGLAPRRAAGVARCECARAGMNDASDAEDAPERQDSGHGATAARRQRRRGTPVRS
jgi:hypothetical protein